MKPVLICFIAICLVGIVVSQNGGDSVDLQCSDTEKVYKNKNNEYYCDCAPGNLYYAPDNQCYNIYSRGPCSAGKYIVLRQKNALCVTNPCGNEENVRYKGKCYPLNIPGGPCPPISEGGGIFSVNRETLQLGCWKQDDDSLSLFDNIPEKACEKGTTRVGQHCRPNA